MLKDNQFPALCPDASNVNIFDDTTKKTLFSIGAGTQFVSECDVKKSFAIKCATISDVDFLLPSISLFSFVPPLSKLKGLPKKIDISEFLSFQSNFNPTSMELFCAPKSLNNKSIKNTEQQETQSEQQYHPGVLAGLFKNYLNSHSNLLEKANLNKIDLNFGKLTKSSLYPKYIKTATSIHAIFDSDNIRYTNFALLSSEKVDELQSFASDGAFHACQSIQCIKLYSILLEFRDTECSENSVSNSKFSSNDHTPKSVETAKYRYTIEKQHLSLQIESYCNKKTNVTSSENGLHNVDNLKLSDLKFSDTANFNNVDKNISKENFPKKSAISSGDVASKKKEKIYFQEPQKVFSKCPTGLAFKSRSKNIPNPKDIKMTGLQIFRKPTKLFIFDNLQLWKKIGEGQLEIWKDLSSGYCYMLLWDRNTSDMLLQMRLDSQWRMNYWANSNTSCFWAHYNYAKSQEGRRECLASRFRDSDAAAQFIVIVNNCMASSRFLV